MNRKTFERAMELKGENDFIIYTNIAEGRGINGVRYKYYRSNADFNDFKQTTEVMGLTDDYVVLDVYNGEGCYPRGRFTTILPLENIVEVYIKE